MSMCVTAGVALPSRWCFCFFSVQFQLPLFVCFYSIAEHELNYRNFRLLFRFVFWIADELLNTQLMRMYYVLRHSRDHADCIMHYLTSGGIEWDEQALPFRLWRSGNFSDANTFAPKFAISVTKFKRFLCKTCLPTNYGLTPDRDVSRWQMVLVAK